MNDEIKEILDFKENADYKRLSCDEIAILKDYITNLQQENQELNDSITWWNNRFNAVQRDYEDYKSRIEKAVEYISSNCILSREWKEVEFCRFLATETITYKALSRGKIKELLNILEGKSDK